MDFGIQIEGQDGLNWTIWKKVVPLVEELGFAGLYRSDHFTNNAPPDLDSLELWISLTWLADHTSRLEFSPLVTPLSFRHPAFTARWGAQVDDLSGGRLTLGVGAGWQVREHHNFSFNLLNENDRFERFEEGLQIITHLLQKDEPLNFSGKYYHFNDAVLLPRPARPGGPPILIGGNGVKRTLPLVARYADEWNAVYIPPDTFKERNSLLSEMLTSAKRDPIKVRRSLMNGLVFASSEQALQVKLQTRDMNRLKSAGVIVGTPDQLAAQFDAYAAAGVQRLILQWLDLSDLKGLELLARVIQDWAN